MDKAIEQQARAEGGRMNAVQTVVKPEDVQVGMWPEHNNGLHFGTPKGVKVTHKPTGIVVICETERSQHKNREKALQFITRALTRPAPTEAEVEAAARRIAELCSPPKGASFEDACEWVPPTIEDLARAALGVG